jgi:primase-polymerase (primpol)-like protein
VCWRYELRKGRWQKTPINCHSGRRANIKNAAAMASFEQGIAYDGKGKTDGIGFVFCGADPFSGIDLDDCRNVETGAL